MPFRHIVLRCERGVLIPRPETEILVDVALEGVDRAAAEGGARVLEVGTGTGCVALSIASERPGTLVTATDLSPRAVELASRNRDALGLEDVVDVVECDLAAGVDPELMGSFAVLVSNPPYIPTRVLAEEVPAEVRDFEPELALDGARTGSTCSAACSTSRPSHSRRAGRSPWSSSRVRSMRRQTWSAPGTAGRRSRSREDLTHRPRVLVAVREG